MKRYFPFPFPNESKATLELLCNESRAKFVPLLISKFPSNIRWHENFFIILQTFYPNVLILSAFPT